MRMARIRYREDADGHGFFYFFVGGFDFAQPDSNLALLSLKAEVLFSKEKLFF